MAVRIGDNGGIRVAPESTYNTAGTVYVVQHARAATLAPKRELLAPGQLGAANPATRRYGVPFAESEIVLAWDDSRAVVGGLLAAAGNLVTSDYTIGDGAAFDNDIGLTVWIDYGGYAVRYTGCRVQSLRWEFQPNSPVVFTVGFLAAGFSSQTVVALTAPAESGIIYESDVSGYSIGGTAIGGLSGSIDVQFPIVGSDRHLLGASTIKKPVYAGRTTITGAFNVELTNDTGENTEAPLALFMNGATLGDIVLGDFALASCYMTGDFPALGEGITQFPINFTAQELVVTTAP